MTAKKRTVVFLVSLILITAWAVSPGPLSAAEKFVTILWTGPLTGPGASIVLPGFQALKDYLTELNSKGGVEGVKIKLVSGDDRYDVSRAISFYMRNRRLPRIVFLYTLGGPQTYGLYPLYTRDKIPVFGSASRFTIKPGYVFLIIPPYQDQFGGALDWMIEDWKKKGKSGMPTVAFLGWAGAAGKESVNGADKYAKQKGIKFLTPEFFPPGTLKYDTWLTRLASAGANYIYLYGVDPDQSFALRDAYNLGLTKKIQFVSGPYGFSSASGIRLLPPEVFEGAVAASPFIEGDELRKHPFAMLFSKYRKQPLKEMYPGYLMGIGAFKCIEKALRIALKEVGYEKIDSEALYQALQKVQGDITQGAMGRVVLGPKTRTITREIKLYRITKGKHVPMGGWRKIPDCLSLATFK